MLGHRLLDFALLFFVASIPCAAWGVNPVEWQVDITTDGDDVTWTSPTAVTTGLAEYDWSYEITELTADVAVLGEFDLLSFLEETSGSGTQGGLPILVFDAAFSEPNTNSSADIRIEVNEMGFGVASGTNIELGRVGILPIRSVDLKATVSIIGVPTGDYDRDGDVDSTDYNIWRRDFGSSWVLQADGNKSTVVDAADYIVWRNNLGVDTTPSAAQSAAIPEPATLTIFCLAAATIGGYNGRLRVNFRKPPAC